MAAQPATTSAAARSRSLRLHAKINLTAPQTTAPAPAPAPPANSAQIPSSTSNVLLFLTNLRLLDLDQEPDWPYITPATFSAKDAAGGQKKRIQCVEWALYQLFLLWDHVETQNKLRPFYPPLDQVQSINLRAALLRCLEQAKKNGVLGRDVVIRKTMLDECRGERLEEILAVFSSVVLKKLVAERALNSGSEYRPTISESLALQNWGYSGDRTELNGLLLAHKASLVSLLTRKNAARARYHDLEELLSSKERELTQRKEQAKASTQSDNVEVSDRAKAEVRRIMRTNWAGNEQWVDCLLFNETRSRKDSLLGARFEDVWAGVQSGKIAEFEDRNVGLLEQLDNRVQLQKTRLEKWDGFRKEMFGGNPPPSKNRDASLTEKKPAKGVDFGFTSHLKLSMDDIEKNKVPSLNSPPQEYLGLLQGMKAELEGIGKPKIPDFSSLVGGSRRVPRIGNVQTFAEPEPEPAADGIISDLSEWEEEPEEVEPLPPKPAGSLTTRASGQTLMIPGPAHGRRRIPKPKPTEEPAKTSIDSDVDHNMSLKVPKRNQARPPALLDHKVEDPSKTTPPPADGPSTHGPPLDPPASTSAKVADPIPSPPRPASPTQALADEILASITNASPSPMKKPRHTLSLTERTRLSMSHSNPFENESPPPSPLKASPTKTIDEPTTHDNLDQGEEYEDLVARTRRSMAGFEAARQKAQLERRRSQRREKMAQKKDNQFPRLDEEEEAVGDASVAEELMEDDTVDYAAVFKSRPRLATSPVPSPNRRWDDDDDE
ncbi:HAUS augmin-like complex subunit 6 N-terminus-domain-containing protein [Biscogniauxia mediterranea]|nr:HAUS augmin-like complex subunit 6 N-terminus-domain-containing protein [Biscogniauxia mediterranea]